MSDGADSGSGPAARATSAMHSASAAAAAAAPPMIRGRTDTSRCQRRRASGLAEWCSAGEAGLQQRLALLAALAAGLLGPAEELGELVVAVALGVRDVGLQAQRVAQA